MMFKFRSQNKVMKKDAFIAVFYHDKHMYEKFKKKNGVHDESNVFVKGRRLYHCFINHDSWYLDILEASKTISSKLHSQTNYIILNHSGKYRRAIIEMLSKEMYDFTKYKTNAKKNAKQYAYLIDKNELKNEVKDILLQQESARLSRDMATEPANKLYPEEFCNKTKKMFEKISNVSVKVLGLREMQKLGLNLVVGVGQSAHHEPKFLIIEADFKAKENVCLVGKGVVFDSGGYDMKPSFYMMGMKGDKTGAAIVVGIIRYLSLLGKTTAMKYNVIGICPLVENLVSDRAHKTGDVLTAYNGKTVEILNTDAEGRLILADALAYACKHYKPKLMIDFATLTGWASMIHCDTSFVFYTPNDALGDIVTRVGEFVGERSVRMPNWPEYIKKTKSKIADFKNAKYGCRNSDGYMAAMFLTNFVETKYRPVWLHMDITHSEHDGLHNCNSMSTGMNILRLVLLGKHFF